MSDLIRRHAAQICMVNCGLPEDQCACMIDTPAAPERIWYNGVTQQSRELRHSPPEVRSAHPRIEYVRRDPAVLAALPEVQAQIDAAREAALREAAALFNDRWLTYGSGQDATEDVQKEILALIRKGNQP